MSQRTLDQRMLGVGTALTDHTITATDVISFADVGASNAIKRDTVQGVLDLAGGGGLVYISTVTASDAASANFTSGIDSTYDVYLVTLDNGVPAANSVLYARISVGGSWRSTGGDYQWISTAATTSATTSVYAMGSSSDTELHIQNSNTLQWDTSGQGTFKFWMYNPSRTSTPRTFIWENNTVNNAVNTGIANGAGSFKGVTTAIDGVQFFSSTGNLSGTFRLYGLAKS